MGKITKIKLRHKATGKTAKVNEADWIGDLGTFRYRGWERIGEDHGDDPDEVVNYADPSKDKENVDELQSDEAPAEQEENEETVLEEASESGEEVEQSESDDSREEAADLTDTNDFDFGDKD